jgi:hypothetical protein
MPHLSHYVKVVSVQAAQASSEAATRVSDRSSLPYSSIWAASDSVVACTRSAVSVEIAQSSSGSKDRTSAARLSQPSRSDRTRLISHVPLASPLSKRTTGTGSRLAARETVRQRRKGGRKPGVTEEVVIQTKRAYLDRAFWAARSG